MKYRKRPVAIEAVQYESLISRPFSELPEWLETAFRSRTLYYDARGDLYVKSLEGDHHVSVGDYIIRGVKGELYACKPDIFELTYEPEDDG